MSSNACKAINATGSVYIATGLLTNFLVDVTLNPNSLIACPANTNCQPGPYSFVITPALVGAGVNSPNGPASGQPNVVRAVENGLGMVKNTTDEQLQDFHTASIQIVTPCIQVFTTCELPPGQACFSANTPVRFHGYVTNCGDITLTNVAVVADRSGPLPLFDPVNGGALTNYVILPVGAYAVFTNSFLPTLPETCAGSAANLCTATARDITTIGGPRAFVTNSVVESCGVCVHPAIVVTKTCPPGALAPGTVLTFGGSVTNTGDIALTNVTVSSDRALTNGSAMVAVFPTLTNGESATFSGSYFVPTNFCSLTTTLTVQGTTLCGLAGVTNSVAATCAVTNTPRLALTQSCPASLPLPGGLLVFSGTVTNTGDVALTNIVIVASLPTNNSLVTVVPRLEPGDGLGFNGSFLVPTNVCSVTDTLSAGGADVCGAIATATLTHTCPVADVQGPTLTCSSNLVFAADAGRCDRSNVTFTVTATDNCSATTTVSTPPSGSTFPVGITTVTNTATDVSGNQSTCTFTVTVNDTELPVINCPGPITVNAPDGQCSSNVIFDFTATDNCSVTNRVSVPASGSAFLIGTTMVTNTATDGSGNTRTCFFTVTVLDKTAPAVTTAQGADETIECPAAPNFNAPIFTDACVGEITPEVVTVTNVVGCTNVFTRTWTANDGRGNVTNRSQVITVIDTTAPVVTTAQGADTTIECPAAAVFSAPVFTDACAGVITSSVVTVTNTTGCTNIITRTWTADDGCGNVTNRSQVITVADTTAPAVTTAQGADATIECPAPPVFSAPVFTDACAGVITPSVVTVTNVVGCTNIITRTWTADDGCGNVTNRSQVITLIDTSSPAVTTAQGADATIECPAAPVFSAPVFTDACAGVITPSVATATNTTGCTNIITRTWTADDGCGNVTNRSQVITLIDTTAPAVTTAQGADATIECPAAAVFSAPVFTDACAGVITSSVVTVTNTTGCTNIVARTWTADDGCGNVTNRSQVITLIDTTAPAVTTEQGADATIECPAAPVFSAPVFTDACQGTITPAVLTVTNVVGSTNIITRTWTANDGCGNITNRSQVVTVEDTPPPTISCPADVTVSANAECAATNVDLGNPVAADSCSVALVTNNAPAIYPLGTNFVMWTVVDHSGNTQSCPQRVIVRDTTAPAITCPPDVIVSANSGCTATNVNLGTPTTSDNCAVANVTNNAAVFGAPTPVGFSLPISSLRKTQGVATVTWASQPGLAYRLFYKDSLASPTWSAVAGDVTAAGTITSSTNLVGGVARRFYRVMSLANVGPVGFPLGTNLVTWMVTDTSGNTNSCVQRVIVRDTSLPVITCPSNLVFATDAGRCSRSNVTFAVTATDNCTITNLVSAPPVGSTFPLGTSTVTNQATDSSGNLSQCTFTITVLDHQPPDIICPPDIITNLAAGSTAVTNLALRAPQSSDNCGAVSITSNAPGIFPVGTNLVRWTATDASGNTNSCQQQVVVLACSGILSATPLTNQTVCPNEPVLFQTTTSSPDQVTYAWTFKGQPLTGQTNNSLWLPFVSPSDGGGYSVEVRTPCAAVTNSATLTLRPGPQSSPAAYTNSDGIYIDQTGPGVPYPSTITLQCVPGRVKNVTVSLFGYRHEFAYDVILVLIGPDGRQVKLMAGCGGPETTYPGVNLTFSDAATESLPELEQITSGTYLPTDYHPYFENDMPAPAVGPYYNTLSAFNGIDPNGPWSLHVFDGRELDAGTNSAWSLKLEWREQNLWLQNPGKLTNGGFRVEVVGQTGIPTILQRSSNLTTWQPVVTNVFAINPGFFVDPAPLPRYRFYRAVQP